MPRKDLYASRRTVLTYVFMRKAARHFLEGARGQPEGNFYGYMGAVLFGAFALEGYLNHIGPDVFPCWGIIERRLGPEEKLVLIANHLSVTINRSKRPFQSFRQLYSVRNDLAHGKTDTAEHTGPDSDRIDRYPRLDWELACEPRNALRLLEDAEEIIRRLHAAAGRRGGPFDFLGHRSRGPVPAPKVGRTSSAAAHRASRSVRAGDAQHATAAALRGGEGEPPVPAPKEGASRPRG